MGKGELFVGLMQRPCLPRGFLPNFHGRFSFVSIYGCLINIFALTLEFCGVLWFGSSSFNSGTL